MKPIFRISLTLVTLVNLFDPLNSLFILPSYTETIESRQFSYPDHLEQLDVIWRFDHSIHLEIDYFELDGQSGDFLFISDLPLTFEESFYEFNETGEFPPFLPESIITNQGLLLSWKANATIEILSEFGTFVYFHAENVPDRGTYPYTGFNITVRDLDMMRTPPPVTTPEPTINTPEPETAIYISKFLNCNEPQKFLEEKDTFKRAIAKIATSYCRETSGCDLSTDLNYTEVSVPSGSGLHYCDPQWDVYPTCVEVTFAIVRVEDGQYLMPVQRLEDMWTKKANEIERQGYCPYIPPPATTELHAWVWMAGTLGLTLILGIIFCMIWFVYSLENGHYGDPPSASEELVKEEETGRTGFFDRENPLYSVLVKIKRGNDEAKYSEMPYGQSNSNFDLSDLTANKYNKTVKNNVLFQEQSVTFEYDNPGFGNEEEEIYGHGHVDFAKDSKPSRAYDDDNNQTFLRIARNDDGGLSDTEI